MELVSARAESHPENTVSATAPVVLSDQKGKCAVETVPVNVENVPVSRDLHERTARAVLITVVAWKEESNAPETDIVNVENVFVTRDSLEPSVGLKMLF